MESIFKRKFYDNNLFSLRDQNYTSFFKIKTFLSN